MSGEDKNLLRARALLERAGHPNTPEEEARSAAVIAARMIYENGFLLLTSDDDRAPSVPAQPVVEPRAARTAAATAEHVQKIWDVFEKNQTRFRRQKTGEEYAVMKSRYDGFCKACRRPYAFGDEVAVMAGRGATHYACRAFWAKVAR